MFLGAVVFQLERPSAPRSQSHDAMPVPQWFDLRMTPSSVYQYSDPLFDTKDGERIGSEHGSNTAVVPM